MTVDEYMEQHKKETKEKSDLCLNCLACCKKFGVPMSYETYASDKKFYQFRSEKVIPLIPGIAVLLVLNDTCKFLTDKGCSVYSDRPDACRIYDGRKDLIMREKCKWNCLTH
jgi:Fe-S-cluster containining protein